MIKNMINRIVGPKFLGAIDYYRFPQMRESWGGPLNGQLARQKIVETLIKELVVNAVVETGTYRGTSTEYFSELCRGPIFTIEANDKLYGYSRIRFLFRRNVVTLHSDSRSGLKLLTTDARLAGKRALFYLDAHWGEELPLAEELDLVFGHWPQSVVLIDDFQVPDDPGYTFDDYGGGKALTLDYTRPMQEKYALNVFFPAASSDEETGEKRGCVLLVADAALARKIDGLDTLRRYQSLESRLES